MIKMLNQCLLDLAEELRGSAKNLHVFALGHDDEATATHYEILADKQRALAKIIETMAEDADTLIEEYS